MNYFGRIAKSITKIVFTLLYRVEIKGRENIPKKGPLLLCANHISLLDMFFIGYRIKRWVYWMAKEELFRNPILGFIITKLGAFPVRRGKADKEALNRAFELLNEGHIVGIFPQGTRVHENRLIRGNVKSGAALIAIKQKVPVLPVAIQGSVIPFHKVRIVFGKPFMLDSETEDSDVDKVDYRKLSQYIMQKVYDLLEEK